MRHVKGLILGLSAVILLGAGFAQAVTAKTAEIKARIPENVGQMEPTVWATVKNQPSGIMLGHWARIPPEQSNNPDEYEYALIKRGDKYAVYFYWKGKEPKQRIKGWQPFIIDGDRIESQVDGSVFFEQFGSVYHNLNGQPVNSRMIKIQ